MKSFFDAKKSTSMCGIFCIQGTNLKGAYSSFSLGRNRGPENSILMQVNPSLTVGFHRLAINGFGKASSEQPLELENCVLVCNGEIYNWRRLHGELGVKCVSQSDCEIIIHMYRHFGILYTLQKLDGVFAFVLYDKSKDLLFAARDQFGVRPMFKGTGKGHRVYSSEMKMMPKGVASVDQFPPGTYQCNGLGHTPFATTVGSTELALSRDQSMALIRDALESAVRKRVLNTDRDVVCLLSGGLDSSLIAALVAREIAPKRLHTYSIGMRGSPDLHFAQMVANHIGSEHHSVELPQKEFLDAVVKVVYDTETYDVTTVRASVGNWLVAQHIRRTSNAKVVFNGDGSDECCGGYLYMMNAPTPLAFDKECRKLLSNIHLFDVLRSDRCISSHGLEARTPFLDRGFVQAYLSVPLVYRFGQTEKQLLRDAFKGVLPDDVLYRRKEAFSDGVSSESESWHKTLQKHATGRGMTEAQYYRFLFDDVYKHPNVIPFQWMPKWVNTCDPSARSYTQMNKHD